MLRAIPTGPEKLINLDKKTWRYYLNIAHWVVVISPNTLGGGGRRKKLYY